MPKTWKQKLESGKQPTVEVAEKAFWGLQPGDKVLIPTPELVDAYVKKIPRGHASDLGEMRATLAKEFGAKTTCPLTSGIFIRIVSEAAHDEMVAGKKAEEITPFWRMIGPKANVRKKLSFDLAIVDQLRAAEGIA